MKFPNTPQLQKWLQRDHPELAMLDGFDIDAARFHAFRKQLHSQGDHKSAEALDQVALFALLTYQGPKKPAEGERYAHDRQTTGTIAPVHIDKTPADSGTIAPVAVRTLPPSLFAELRSLRTWLRIIAVILFLLLAKTVHGQSIASGDITVANASCTATSCVSMTLFGQSGTIAVQVTNTFTGTLQFEGTLDGTNYVAVNGLPVASATTTTSTTATGMWQVSSAGLQKFQVRASALASGTATVYLRASPSAMGRGNGGGGSIQLTGDVTAGPGSSPLATTVAKVNGVAYSASPSTNTVPVVTAANTVTYEAVPNAALANSAITINGTSVSLGGTRSLALNSSDFANEGTTTTVLHGAAAGNPSFGAVVSADLNITTTTCTNQFVRSLSSAAAGTCATVANADLTNSSITLNAGTNTGYTAPGAMSLGSTYTFGATTDNLRFNALGLGTTAPTTAGQLTMIATLTNSLNGAASTPAATFTGTIFTGGSATTTKPLVLIEPTGTTTTGWSTSGTGLGINLATGFSGKGIDFQINGSTQFNVSGTDGSIGTNGSISSGAINSSNNITAGAGSAFILSGRSAFTSPSNGVMKVSNNGATDFTRFQFGGTTTAFPALARSGTQIQVQLADGSALAPIVASTYYGNTTVGGTLALVSTSTAGTTDSITLGVGNNGATVMVSVTTAGVMVNSASTATARISITASAETAANGIKIIDGSVVGQIWPSSGGGVTIDTNGSANSLKVNDSGHIFMPNLTTSAGVQSGYVCSGASGELIIDSGLCLASSARFKDWLADMTCEEASRIVAKMKPGWFRYKNEGMPAARADWTVHAGFLAEDVEAVEPRLVNHEKDGRPHGVQYEMFTAVLAKVLQCRAA